MERFNIKQVNTQKCRCKQTAVIFEQEPKIRFLTLTFMLKISQHSATYFCQGGKAQKQTQT